MCDKDTQKDVEEYLRRHPEMSRRDFTKLATGAGLAMMMPPMANAQSVSCLLYTSPSPRDGLLSRMPSSA